MSFNKSSQDDIDNENSQSAFPDDHMKWRYQDESFNNDFRLWRKENKGQLGFYYVDNPNELTYQDRVGFVHDYPEAAETSSIRHVYNMIGISLFTFALVDALFFYVIPLILEKFGFDINLDFYMNKTYGNDWIRIILYIIWGFLRRVMPFYICFKQLKMPIKVIFPIKITNKSMFKYAVPIMLMVYCVASFCDLLYGVVLDSMKITTATEFIFPTDKTALIVALFAQIILIPTLSELVAHGILLQLLRQFGDGSAIVFTAFITAATIYDIGDFCSIFLISIVIGYFTVRTGSIITSVLMRVTYHFLYVGDAYLYKTLDSKMMSIFSCTVLFLCLFIGICSAVVYLNRHSDSFGMAMKDRYLTFTQKTALAFTSAPILFWLTVTFILTLLNTNFVISF